MDGKKVGKLGADYYVTRRFDIKDFIARVKKEPSLNYK
jgi:DNA-binding response OmpR family regulator